MCLHICLDCRAKTSSEMVLGKCYMGFIIFKGVWLYKIIADKGLLSIILNINRILIYVANRWIIFLKTQDNHFIQCKLEN